MRRSAGVILGGLGLAACGNPYGLDLGSINLDARQTPSTIQFTDPKLYKREALINERRKERSYLQGLLSDSEKAEFDSKFQPEIVRELEVIQAFSATVGAKIDPAAGAAAQRDSEVAELKHKLELVRLEMQLSQLQRDAELQKKALEQQTQPTPATEGSSGSGGTPPSPVQPPDPQALLTQIEQLRAKLESRLGAEVRPPNKAGAGVGPIDVFNDRAAYRNVLKSEINAVSLDEIHDKNGNSLFRIQLRATVLPGPKDYLDTLGILRMEIEQPNLNDKANWRDLYHEWLLHANRRLNLPPVPGLDLAERRLRPNPAILTLGSAGELFVITLLELPKQGSKGSQNCAGVQQTERWPDKCWYLRIASPVIDKSGHSQYGALGAALLNPAATKSLLGGARAGIATGTDHKGYRIESETLVLNGTCDRFESNRADLILLGRTDGADAGITPNQALSYSRSIFSSLFYLSTVVGFLSESDFGDNDSERAIASQFASYLDELRALRETAAGLLSTVAGENRHCESALLAAASTAPPPEFVARLKGVEPRLAVYDVAPAERVQRVSTVARAADAIALAAALAGQLPSYGVGLSGNFAYSRTAVGKADAIERAPLVVGIVEPQTIVDGKLNKPAFGWLLGPQVSVDPSNKALVLSQRLKPYDLYADVSIPAWWPSFTLIASTAWAPNWRDAKDGATALLASDAALLRTIRVPMEHNAADMDALTTVLLKERTGQRVAYPSIASIEPRELSACAGDIQFQIRGENIWRTSLVHIGGLAVDENAISVLPDMRGVLVKLKASEIPRVKSGTNVVTAWTKDGPATYPIVFEDRRHSGGNCEPRAAQIDPKAPTIQTVTPGTLSVCDTNALFTIQGRNLAGASSAILGTIPAEKPIELAPRNGTVLQITVPKIDGPTKIGNTLKELSLAIHTPRGVATAKVDVTQSTCSKGS